MSVDAISIPIRGCSHYGKNDGDSDGNVDGDVNETFFSCPL